MTTPDTQEQMAPLPEPFRKQGQQICYDGCDKAFCDFYAREQMHAYAREHAAQQLTEARARIEALERIGGPMANVCFNWAQKPGHALTSDDVALLDKLRREWDAARSAGTAGGGEG